MRDLLFNTPPLKRKKLNITKIPIIQIRSGDLKKFTKLFSSARSDGTHSRSQRYEEPYAFVLHYALYP